MPLGEAHDTATDLEDAIRGELGSDVEVESHIEPQPERMLQGQEAPSGLTAEVSAALLELAAAHRAAERHPHRSGSGATRKACSCTITAAARPPTRWSRSTTTSTASRPASRTVFGDIRRVIAHAEPLGADRHAL